MSIDLQSAILPKLTPEKELNKLINLVPINHPLKGEVSSYLTQMDNIKNGKLPNGQPAPDGMDKDKLMNEFALTSLINKGYQVLLTRPTKQDAAIKNFLISAIKDGDKVDVGSLTAAFLPDEVNQLMSKVLQTSLVGKNIFQIKDAILGRLTSLQSQAEAIVNQANTFVKSLEEASTFKELPEVNNALVEVQVLTEAVESIATSINERVKQVNTTLVEIEKISEGVVEVPTVPVDPTPKEELPPVPAEIASAELPPPPLEQEEDFNVDSDEEETEEVFT